MTPKQKIFVEEYLIDFNAVRSAIAAGYSKHSAKTIGPQNLRRQYIKEAIIKAMEERSAKIKIDAEWVLLAAKKIYDRCMQEEQILNKEGKPTGEYRFEHSGANKALEIIGKHVDIQAFKERQEVTGADGGPQEHKWIIELYEAGTVDNTIEKGKV